MMLAMSDVDESDRPSGTPVNERGVLSNLPRTRPQRASARRAAARKARSPATEASDEPAGAGKRPQTKAKPAKGKPAKAAKAARTTAKAGARSAPTGGAAGRAGRPRDAASEQEQVPRQGFECEGEAATGPVHPPGGAELVGSAAELLGEVAKAGVSAGERLVRDLLGRLPRP